MLTIDSRGPPGLCRSYPSPSAAKGRSSLTHCEYCVGSPAPWYQSSSVRAARHTVSAIERCAAEIDARIATSGNPLLVGVGADGGVTADAVAPSDASRL